MRKESVALAVAAMLASVSTALAQAKHEYGVDAAIVYLKPSGGAGVFQLGTPVDVRIGFLGKSTMSFEPRFTFMLLSGGGSSAYSINPGLNLLWRMHGATYNRGMYFTAGANLDIESVSIGGFGSSSGVVPGINAGVGGRGPMGANGALRYEGFVGYSLKNNSLGVPDELKLGVRFGFSFFN